MSKTITAAISLDDEVDERVPATEALHCADVRYIIVPELPDGTLPIDVVKSNVYALPVGSFHVSPAAVI